MAEAFAAVLVDYLELVVFENLRQTLGGSKCTWIKIPGNERLPRRSNDAAYSAEHATAVGRWIETSITSGRCDYDGNCWGYVNRAA
jgi:hypothetical protein